MNRLHHVLEDRVQQLSGLFGVAVRQQLHRRLRVGEEDRDLLPLALKRGRLRQDAFRQMLRGVGNGGRNLVRGRVAELPAARPAETLHTGDLGSAVRARQGEPCAALPTEPRPLRIRSLAPWTPHGGDKSPKKLRMLVNPKNTPSVAEGTAVQEAAAGHNKCQHPKEAAPVSRSFDDHVSPSSLLVLSTTFVDLDVSII